jgi:hypothetical protein
MSYTFSPTLNLQAGRSTEDQVPQEHCLFDMNRERWWERLQTGDPSHIQASDPSLMLLESRGFHVFRLGMADNETDRLWRKSLVHHSREAAKPRTSS